ncbi:hypothetical protein [Aureimonas sp. N4]|nr:hypothetical protein [Aureimonas sp. N4]
MTQPRSYTRPDDTIMIEVETHVFVAQDIAKRLGLKLATPAKQAVR